MLMPHFSIIIPVYNVAPWLGEALESLRAQSLTTWEGICVDDGSTDTSGDILLARLRQESRLRVIFQPNHGVSVARNRALERARGTWTGCLDADDAVAPWWLEEAKRCFDTTATDLVRFAYKRCSGSTAPQFRREGACTTIETPATVQAWGMDNFIRTAFVWAYFVRRALAQRVSFPSGLTIKEDCIYGLMLLPHLKTVCLSSAVPYAYRQHRYSALHRRYSVEVPLQLCREGYTLCQVLPRQAFAPFCLHILTDWVARLMPEEKSRYAEVRRAFARFLKEKVFTFRELVPWHWRVSVACFLSTGVILPLRVHSFFYRAYLKLFSRRP